MKYFVTLVIVISCAAAALVSDISRLQRVGGCKSNSDCSPSQCCVDGFKWLIATRRDIINGRIAAIDSTPPGRCVNYIPEEGNCHYASFRSCGCIPGTQCKYYPAEALKLNKGKRGMMAPKPGTSKCE